MLKRAALVCAISSVVSLWAQAPPKIDPGSQPAVNQLAAIARTIKECPRALSSEKKWGKRAEEIERWYVGPPQNVVWDVLPSTSVRSPYLGYIEFSLRYEQSVPDEAKDKFVGSAGDLLLLSQGPVKHRYEFDLGPSGLELTRMLYGNKAATDESPDDSCWQKAARDLQGVSNPSAATQIAADVGATSIISFLGSAFLLRCDTEDVIRK